MNVPLTKSKLDELAQGEGEGSTTFLKGDIHRRSPTDQVRAPVVSCQPPMGASSLRHQTTAIHFLTDTVEAAKTAHSALQQLKNGNNLSASGYDVLGSDFNDNSPKICPPVKRNSDLSFPSPSLNCPNSDFTSKTSRAPFLQYFFLDPDKKYQDLRVLIYVRERGGVTEKGEKKLKNEKGKQTDLVSRFIHEQFLKPMQKPGKQKCKHLRLQPAGRCGAEGTNGSPLPVPADKRSPPSRALVLWSPAPSLPQEEAQTLLPAWAGAREPAADFQHMETVTEEITTCAIQATTRFCAEHRVKPMQLLNRDLQTAHKNPSISTTGNQNQNYFPSFHEASCPFPLRAQNANRESYIIPCC
ncbi:hypothetical protein Anapl_06241 [Anas platyrhynchos]|uniref:Uncharacterized protein n=1 Tax=Anas platyrhynchos TaxID=8839 RepID=R0L9X6_ANAPL|nr:hypothetical protein Anapl_06241 [Anas platyrhynchos]